MWTNDFFVKGKPIFFIMLKTSSSRPVILSEDLLNLDTKNENTKTKISFRVQYYTYI